MRYIRPYKTRISIVGLLIFVNVGLQILNPQVLRYYLDSVSDVSSVSALTRAALLFIGIAVIQEMIYVVNVYLSVDLAWRTTNDLRYDLMEHCVSLDMTFHNKYKPGEMIERVDGDVNALSNFFSTFSLGILILLITCLILVMG